MNKENMLLELVNIISILTNRIRYHIKKGDLHRADDLLNIQSNLTLFAEACYSADDVKQIDLSLFEIILDEQDYSDLSELKAFIYYYKSS